MMKRALGMAGLALVGAIALQSGANASVTFSGSASSRAAQAVFDIDGSNNLVVALSNTASGDAGVNPTQVLTGVFWDGPGVLGAATGGSAHITGSREAASRMAGASMVAIWAQSGRLCRVSRSR